MITQSQITDAINKAQQRIASFGIDILDYQDQGKCTDQLWLKLDYLVASVDALNDGTLLTNAEKEKIVNCMNSVGELGALAVVPFTFKSTTVLVVPLGGTFLLLNDTPSTYSSFAGFLPAVNNGETDLEFKKPSVGGKVLYVSLAGDDATAKRGNTLYHYLTPIAAQTASSKGDTIVIFPGTYDIGAGSIGKAGVDWILYSGAVITNSAGGEHIIDDGGSLMNFSISGDGEFRNTVASKYVLNMSNASSDITISGKFDQQWNDAAGHAMLKEGGGTLTLKEATIVLADTSAYAVASTTAQDVKVYEAYSNATGHDADISYLINNIQLDSNVS